MSTNGISFSGLSSGIDTDSIINKLIALEGQSVTRLKTQQKGFGQKDAVFGTLLDKISAVAQASGGLNTASAFNPVKAASSDPAVATVAGGADSPKGVYALKVTRLAQAQKLASAPQTDATTALGKSGTLLVNGKALRVEATDSLRTLAGKINDLGAGATASLIDGGAGSAYLTVGSTKTGAANRPLLADATGSVLADLGVLGPADAPRTPLPNGAASAAFADATTPLAGLLGATGTGGLGPASLTIGGTAVTLDLSTDGLQTIADRINAANVGAQATVAAVSVEGATRYRLEIAGTPPPALADGAGSPLHALGVLQKAPANELLAGQDASYSLDGVALTSATNEIKGAIPGATITLLAADAATPKTTAVTLARDDAAVKARVTDFVSAVNGALGYIKDASQFDKASYASGPLFGDATARQFESSLTTALFRTVANPGAKYTNLAAIGFSLDKTGALAVDDAQLNAALADRPDEVRRLFQSTGTSSAPGLSYVSSTSKTPGSVGDGFEVNVTQVATKSAFVGATAPTAPSAASERLTFAGALFGTATVELVLDPGSTLAGTVARINADPRLKDNLAASVENGRLRLDSRRYGAGGRFSVASNATAGAANSGVGTGGAGTKTDGLDVAGTIGGGAATGYGQFLTATAENAAAQGLQVAVTTETTGSVGRLRFVKGLSSSLSDALATFSDATNGLVSAARKAAQDSSSAIDDQVAKANAALDRKTTELKAKFSLMEQTIAKLQSQGQRLSGLTAAK